MIRLISVLAAKDMLVVFELPKGATSDGPFGTVAGDQFCDVFQSPLVDAES